MVLEITQYGNPVLRKKCKVIEEITEEVKNLADDMIVTMEAANGVGLAAPQVGEDIRLAVVDVSHDPECISIFKVNGEDSNMLDYMPLVFINPELKFGKEKSSDTEGCLSIQELRASVRRPQVVKASLPQLDGTILEVETDGLLSRAIQHEVDHLNGILFSDRVSAAVKPRVKRHLKMLLSV